MTLLDHETTLPTAARYDADHDFSGQRFVHYEGGAWRPAADYPGFEVSDLAFAAATEGLARAQVLRNTAATQQLTLVAERDARLHFVFVLAGSCALAAGGAALPPDSAFNVLAGDTAVLTACSADLQLLQVAVHERQS